MIAVVMVVLFVTSSIVTCCRHSVICMRHAEIVRESSQWFVHGPCARTRSSWFVVGRTGGPRAKPTPGSGSEKREKKGGKSKGLADVHRLSEASGGPMAQ